MAPTGAASTAKDDSSLEESAREKLGVQHWDRPVIFREAAEAATDTRLPYWSLLVLSGSIATLGLALDNAAVVIGAMLIAPLLAPTMGLALGLAMGDLRLASQSGLAVVLSTVAVIAAAMVLTFVLPFQTVTPEITARTRPTTLDLGIAVFSGLAGAVVAVTRRKGLSAAIPGVAVAVALIPPLAVAGYSAGAGFQWSFIKGSMLLYGANLAGIVFSGTLVFLLIGMHRPNVMAAAAKWHESAAPTRIANWAARTRWLPEIRPIRSPAARISLVLAFVIVLGIPLTITLGEIVRETRVQHAVNSASKIFEVQGRSSILSLQSVIGENDSQALLRVATTEWFDDRSRERFERTASAGAGEPIRLVLEQLPASSGDLDQLARLFPSSRRESVTRTPSDLSTLLAPATGRMQEVIAGLSLPDSVFIVGFEMLVGGRGRRHVTIGYMGQRHLSEDVIQILTRQMRTALTAADLIVRWDYVPTDTLVLTGTAADSTRLRGVANLASRYEDLRLTLITDTSRSGAYADSTIRRLLRHGLESGRLDRRHTEGSSLSVVPQPSARR